MKRLIASFLSLSLLLVSCTTSPPKATHPSIPDPMNTPWDNLSIFENGLIASERTSLSKHKGASIYHIDLTIANNFYEVNGSEEVRYTNMEDISLNEVQFHLFPNVLGGSMEISNLQVDGLPVQQIYALENSLMIVPLSKPLEPGQSIIIRMDFAVTVPQSLELNYGVLAYANDTLTLAHAYPMIAVYDDDGWNAEIPSQDGDVTYSDIAFYLVRIRAPKKLTLVTTGSEIRLDEDGQAQVLTVASGPARDFFLAASPYYEETSQQLGEVTIRSYAPKSLKDGSKFALDIAKHAIEIFGKRYAPYPYTEFDIVATPTLALGIEYPGIVSIASRVYNVNEEYRGVPANIYLESTVAHETGHQWFYNLVGNDQLDDPWLDESLTQFVTLQYYIDTYGEEGASDFRASLKERWAHINNKNIPIGLPVIDYSGTEYSAIVYGRGPLFFTALRKEMGAEAFGAFMKEYTQTFSWGISTPETLQKLAEHNCQCNLQALFDQWVYP